MTDPNQNGATVDINQEALTLAYNDAFDGGFSGTQAEFFQLLCEDEQAQGWSFESAQLGGFEGSFDDFKGLLSLPDIIEKVDNETPKEDDEVKKKDTFGPLLEEDTRSLSLESEFSSADPNFSVEKSVKFQEEYKKDKYKKAIEYFKDARPDLDFPTKEEYYGVGKAPMLTETSEYKDVTDISADEKRVREEQAKIAQEYREGKRELTPQQSLVNTLHNSLGQLATVDDTFRYMYGVATNDMKQIGLAEAEMERVDSMAQPTMEFTDGASLTEDPAKFAAAVIDGFSGFATSAIIYQLTGGPYTMGIGLASDMIARSIRDHNKTKAEANKTTVEELHKTGEFEVLIPGSIGVLAYKLEKAGIKGVGTAINALATKGYSKLAKLLTFGGSQFKEGATEFGQNILEDINNFLGSLNVEESKKIYKGRPDLLAEEIGKEFVKSATSRESREAFYKGLAGGAGGTTLGATYNKVMSVTKSKEETDKQDDLTERILDLEAMERNPSLNESEKEGIKTSKDAALEELKRIQIEAEKMAENYSQEQIDEFVQLREEQVFLNNQLWTTENSKNLNREQKDKVIQNLQDKFQKNVSRVKEVQKEAIEGVKTKKEGAPSQPAQEEVLVQEETDSKGRVFKRYAITTEKDGIKTTTYTFNRSDKDASQRNKSSVKPEVAFGERFEVDSESEYNDVIFEDELKVVGVENIVENPNPRSDQTQYQSDVVVENKEGSRTTFKGIRLREKTKGAQEDIDLQSKATEKEGVETEQGAKNLIESLKKWSKLGLNKFSNLRSKFGLDPKRGNVDITRLQEAYKGGMKSETYAALSRFQNIETLIKKLSKNDQDKARVVSDKILRGEKVTQEEFSSFEEISKLSSDFRLAIDKLSQELIDLGILPPDSEQNISDNIGEYLNRAYLAFTDPNYKPGDITRQKAKRFLQKNPKLIIEQAEKRADEKGISLDEAIAEQADVFLDSLLEKGDSGSPMSREFKLNKSILKQKKGVPKPLREFLGEIKDGRQAAYISHLKLASLVNTARYQKGVLDSGLGKFIYEKNDPNRPPDSVEIKGSAYDILSGYYASPDVVDAIIPKQEKVVEGAMKVLTDLNGLVKGWKTVYNPTSYLRNYISTMVMLATRGDLSMKQFIDSHKAYLNTLKGKKVFEEKMFEYKKMGIVGQNIDVGVIKSAMRDNDTDMETGLYKRMTKKDDSQESILRRSIKSIYKLGKLGQGIQFTAERMQTIFQAGDDIGRMMAYEKRKEAHADMMFDKTVEQLDDSELKQVQEAAAEEIKDQYNNYDRVPPLIKKLSRNILVGSFVQFPAEMIRNTANTIGSTITRMKDKNPKVRKDAKTRLATFLGAQSALAIGTTFLGDSIMDMFNMDDEEEDEVQRVKDLRNVVAPWSKNHKIIVRKMGDNKLSYVDVSANNPYNMISRLIQKVGIDGIGNNADTYEVMFDFFGPFLDQEILSRAIFETLNGQTESGKPLFFSTDGTGEKLTKGTEHILKEIMPGYMRFVQRVTDEDKSTVNELISLTGFRTTEVDLDTSLYFKMRAAYSDMQDLQASYRMNLSKGKDTYDDSAIKYGEAITKANEVLQSHIRLGLDPKLAYQQMKKMMGKNQKFSNNEIKAIIYGVEIAFKEAKK
jgi:hypothetical protein